MTVVIPMSVNTLTASGATEIARKIFGETTHCRKTGGECQIVGNGGKVFCYGASWEEAIARAKWLQTAKP